MNVEKTYYLRVKTFGEVRTDARQSETLLLGRIEMKLTKDDKKWAKEVKDRDGWKCVICGSTIRPNAHHIIAREVTDLRWDVYNGITLCPKHHRFSRVLSAHQNPFLFFMWLKERRWETYKYLEAYAKRVLWSMIY